MNKRTIATVLTFMIMALLACVSSTPPGSGISYAYSTFTPSPLSGYDQEAAYAAAQATLASGQSEMIALSHQATVVSLNMDQAAAIAAQATVDFHQRQLMELSIQATEVSLNMARAAATQQFVMDQAQLAQNATATAQSQAATATAQSQATTATVSAYILNVTQTAQAQAILDGHAAETAQAHATLTAYPLTATPEAATQAYLGRARDGRERRALWEEFVVTPVKAVLSALVIILLIVGGVLAFRRLMPVLEWRLRNPRGDRYVRPLSLAGDAIVDLEPYDDHRLEQLEPALLGHPQLTSDDTSQVEIIDPSEPSIINWIAEAERKLRTEGRTQP